MDASASFREIFATNSLVWALRVMPAVFEKMGIRFLFPDNWTLDESEMLEGNNTVSVYSPGGAFWSVTLHPPGVDPAQLVATAVAAMRQIYDALDEEPADERFAGREMVGREMNFYCLDLTNTAIARSFGTSDGTYLVFCQADDRELEQVAPVFEAITRSLATQ
jgi:hypothetical protein